MTLAPWGASALTIALLVVYVGVQVAVGALLPHLPPGDLLAVATLVAGLASLGIWALVLRWRPVPGLRASLSPPPWRALLLWTGAQVLLYGAGEGLTALVGQPLVPPFMHEVWTGSHWRPLVVLAMVAMAPLHEEAVFRGLWVPGLAGESRRLPRLVGAIALPSLVWTALHIQYDLLTLGILFTEGLFLGWARVRTGNLWVPVALHGVVNAISLVEVAI